MTSVLPELGPCSCQFPLPLPRLGTWTQISAVFSDVNGLLPSFQEAEFLWDTTLSNRLTLQLPDLDLDHLRELSVHWILHLLSSLQVFLP